MEPIINLDDPIRKQVGKRKSPAPLRILASEKQGKEYWRAAGMGPRIPKGVYRFKSHEEADEWLWKMMTRPKPVR